MQPDAAPVSFPLANWQQAIPAHWRAPLARLTLAALALIAIMGSDWAAMFDQWWNSSTFNHILLVPFIIGWLIWARAGELAKLQPECWWPGLIPFAGAMMLWLLGAVSSLDLFRQAGAVAALASLAITLLGPRVSAGLAFPLAYMAFLVPVGEELVPWLQMITADITIALTEASGIPAHIEGVFIDTPAGLFEVAEACSGVNFLIAMVALGTLVAHVAFRSNVRRAAFMIAAIALPIIANGIRAWGTIHIAQSQGVEFAAGVDHIVYGWVFFAIIVAVLIACAWPFFDRSANDPMIDAAGIRANGFLRKLSRLAISPALALAALAVLLIGAQAWAGAASRAEAKLPDIIALTAPDGWRPVAYEPSVAWMPLAEGADRRAMIRLESGPGRQVDVFVAVYAAQREGKEAGAFGQGALIPDTPWRWLGNADAVDGANTQWLQANGVVRRYAETSYRSGDLLTGSNLDLKLATMRDALAIRARPTAMLILSAEGPQADTAVAALRRDIGDRGEWMDRAIHND
jgi:exosortase A